MKKGLIFALTLVLLLTAAAPASATGAETEPALPELVTGTVQGPNMPALLCRLNLGDSVEVTGNPDEKTATVETEFGTGTMEMQLLRFAGEEQPESWIGYTHWNAGLYETYELCGEPLALLKTNTQVEVLEELEDCYMVTLEEQTGFIAKDQLSKWPIRYSSGGGSSGGGSSNRDGGDISIAFYGNFHLLSNVTVTGSAQTRVDGAKVILTYFDLGDTVQIVAEEEQELEGYLKILVDGTYAYIPEGWVLKDGDPAFESWDGYAGYGCKVYDNYLLRGKSVKQLYGKLTVLWTAGDVSLVQSGDTIGYVSTATVRTTPLPPSSGSGSGSGKSGSGSGSWTPPAM